MEFKTLLAIGAVAFFASVPTGAISKTPEKIMAGYLDDITPSDTADWRPTLADSRFEVKSIWVEKKNARKIKNGKIGKAFQRASDGGVLYSDEFVNVKRREIPNFEREMTSSRKWALGATLAGNVSGADIEAAAKWAREKGYELNFTYEDAYIEWVDTLEMNLAHTNNQHVLDGMRSIFQQADLDNKMPRHFTVTSVMKVKNAELSLVRSKDVKAGGSLSAGPFGKLFAALGFNIDREKNVVIEDTVTFDGVHPIAYQSAMANKENGLISDGAASLTEVFDIAAPEEDDKN